MRLWFVAKVTDPCDAVFDEFLVGRDQNVQEDHEHVVLDQVFVVQRIVGKVCEIGCDLFFGF